VITALACSLVGTEQSVTIVPRTRAAALYGVGTVIEDYRCNYGVNPEYHAALEQAGLTLSGFGAEGELRIVEIATHPFFVATLFLPQMRSSFATPHPLFVGFATAVEAVIAHR